MFVYVGQATGNGMENSIDYRSDQWWVTCVEDTDKTANGWATEIHTALWMK